MLVARSRSPFQRVSSISGRVLRTTNRILGVVWTGMGVLAALAALIAIAVTDVVSTFLCAGTACAMVLAARRRFRRAGEYDNCVAEQAVRTTMMSSLPGEWAVWSDDPRLPADITVALTDDLAFVVLASNGHYDEVDVAEIRLIAGSLLEAHVAPIGVVCLTGEFGVAQFEEGVLVVSHERLAGELLDTAAAYACLRV